MLAERVAAVAAVGDNPARHIGQPLEQRDCVRQFVRLAWRQDERYGPADDVGDHAGLGPIAAARPAKCFTTVPLCWSVVFLAAPAALW